MYTLSDISLSFRRVFFMKFCEAVHFCRAEGWKSPWERGGETSRIGRTVVVRMYWHLSRMYDQFPVTERWTLHIPSSRTPRKIRAWRRRHRDIYAIQWGPSSAVSRAWPTSACIIARLSTGTQTPIFDHYWIVNRDRLTRYLWRSLTRHRNRSWSEPIVLAPRICICGDVSRTI